MPSEHVAVTPTRTKLRVVSITLTLSKTLMVRLYVAPTSCKLMFWVSVFILVPDIVIEPEETPGVWVDSFIKADSILSPIRSMYQETAREELSGSEMVPEKFNVEFKEKEVTLEAGEVIETVGEIFWDRAQILPFHTVPEAQLEVTVLWANRVPLL